MDTTTLVFVAGIWLGVAFGILGALLLSPKSGRAALPQLPPFPVLVPRAEAYRQLEATWRAEVRAGLQVMRPDEAFKVHDVT